VVSVSQFLYEHGPSRSSLIVDALIASGIKAEAARQRVSRAGSGIRSFPIPLLPKREAFLYLEKDRNGDRFWRNFIRDLRATGSVYSAAIDGMIARGGMVPADEFCAISGAPIIAQRGQVHSDLVAKRLIAADFLSEVYDSENKPHYELPYSLASATHAGMRARDLTERVLLDGLREWCRKTGMASYNAVRVRGDQDLKPIGPFAFDLAGPSYLLPLQGGANRPGFVVADVFAEGRLTVEQVQFFIRKARMLKATLKGTGVLSILVAEEFTGAALTAGHAAGVMMATPKDLFGRRVGEAIASLCEVLKNAAKYASSSPERLQFLLDNLFDIEGRSKNLRGVLFELVAGYLARRDAASIDMNVTAKDPKTGKTAEIDVQKITHQTSSVTAIECKGKEPGGVLTKAEVETWLRKITTIREHYRVQPHLREAEHRFELWTSGTIELDALALLEEEKLRRLKSPIDWKDGQDVLALARAGKEKGISDALYQHFIHHPYAEAAKQLEELTKALSEAAKTKVSPLETPRTKLLALPAPAHDFVTRARGLIE
jgi:hypothetical protein